MYEVLAKNFKERGHKICLYIDWQAIHPNSQSEDGLLRFRHQRLE